MFTGIIEALGTITEIQREDKKARLTITTGSEFSNFEAGESISVNGVCLTAIQPGSTSFIVDVSTETLTRTGFSQIKKESQVNLERSLTPSKKISGHFVSGHVDQIGSIVSIKHKTGEVLFRFKHPAIRPFHHRKGIHCCRWDQSDRF